MGEFKFSCPQCGQHIACDTYWCGNAIDCPNCQSRIQVPDTASSKDTHRGSQPVSAEPSVPQIPIPPPRQSAVAGRKSHFVLVTVIVLIAIAVVGITGVIFGVNYAKSQRTEQARKSMLSAYRDVRSYQDSVSVTVDTKTGGITRYVETVTSMAFVKPNRANLRIKRGIMEVNLVSDGKQLWTAVNALGRQYTVREAPESMSELVSDFWERHRWLGIDPDVLALYGYVLAQAPRKLSDYATNITGLGVETVQGKSAVVLQWEMGKENQPIKIPVKAWVVTDGGVIWQLREDYSSRAKVISNLSSGGPEYEHALVNIAVKDVKVNEEVPDTEFVFTPAAGARQVEVFDVKELLAMRFSPRYSKADLGRKIPPRDTDAPATLIDLTDYYNAPLTEPWHGNRGNDLALLPYGIQTMGNVKFDIRGLIQLCGGEVLLDYPKEVKGIRIGATCQRIHFLHAAGWTVGKAGQQIGTYVLHYAHGNKREIPIVYGRDLQDWWDWDSKPPTNSEIAWNGANTLSETRGRAIRLYKSTVTSPLPSLELKSIDFASALLNSAPFLVAITVE